MEKVLSQEEVDSLLNGIDEGKVETETDIPENTEGLQVYDFSSKSAPYHQRMPALGIINERFISFINTNLSDATGSAIDVSVREIDTVRYGEFCRSLPLPASLNILKMKPLRGYAALVLEGPLVFSFVDIFFGGKCSTHVKLEGRSFTAIEKKIIQRIVNIVLQDYERAWADVHNLEMEYSRTEVDPQFAGIAKPDEMIITTRFNVEIGNFSGSMSICIPYNTLESIKSDLSQNYKTENVEADSPWRQFIEKKLKEIELDLHCTLGMTTITGREILGMQKDDVILLDQRIKEPVGIYIGASQKMVGFPGSVNNKKAIRIARWGKME